MQFEMGIELFSEKVVMDVDHQGGLFVIEVMPHSPHTNTPAYKP